MAMGRMIRPENRGQGFRKASLNWALLAKRNYPSTKRLVAAWVGRCILEDDGLRDRLLQILQLRRQVRCSLGSPTAGVLLQAILSFLYYGLRNPSLYLVVGLDARLCRL